MAPWQNLYSSDIKQKASSKAGLGFGVDISLLWQPRFHGHTPRKR